MGGYVPGRSDVDLFAVVERPLRDEEVERMSDARDVPAPLDLRVATADTAARPTEAPPMELYARLAPPSHPT
jgi:hypothetical protein